MTFLLGTLEHRASGAMLRRGRVTLVELRGTTPRRGRPNRNGHATGGFPITRIGRKSRDVSTLASIAAAREPASGGRPAAARPASFVSAIANFVGPRARGQAARPKSCGFPAIRRRHVDCH